MNFRLVAVALCIIYYAHAQQCGDICKSTIVETIPIGLDTPGQRFMTTTESWKYLLQKAEQKIEIGSYYWTLQDEHVTAIDGVEIFNGLVEAGTTRGIDIRVVKIPDSRSFPNNDTHELVRLGAAQVRDVDVTKLIGSGIIHTKMWLVDRKHFYLGSSNLDWRALTQVKELGVMITDCPCLGEDMGKAFDIYWQMGEENAQVPPEWDDSLNPNNNMENPLEIKLNDTTYNTYISSAPPVFCPNARTQDLDAVFDLIDNAKEFIHIALMDYFPMILFDGPLKYWPEIENRLRSAAIDRKVKVKLMMAKWNNTRAQAQHFLKSLENLNTVYANVDVQVKMYLVPSTEEQAQIPFARVNHNKYMVTEEAVYIGTSNWSGDYFISTAGIGFIAKPSVTPPGTQNIRDQVEEIFQRDWISTHAKNVSEIYPGPEIEECPPPPSKDSSYKFTHSVILIVILSFISI